MGSRLVELKEAVKNIGGCCCLVLRKYKVSYFQYSVDPNTNLQGREWVQKEILAYNRNDAAQRIKPGLRPGYNCFVIRVISGGD